MPPCRWLQASRYAVCCVLCVVYVWLAACGYAILPTVCIPFQIGSNVSYGLSVVFYNAYLPLLTGVMAMMKTSLACVFPESHPDILEMQSAGSCCVVPKHCCIIFVRSACGAGASMDDVNKQKELVQNKISTYGSANVVCWCMVHCFLVRYMAGYLGGVVMLLISGLVFFFFDQCTAPRSSLGLFAVLWYLCRVDPVPVWSAGGFGQFSGPHSGGFSGCCGTWL